MTLNFWSSGFLSAGITGMRYHTWLRIRAQGSQHARQELFYQLSPISSSQGLPKSYLFPCIMYAPILFAWEVAGVGTVPGVFLSAVGIFRFQSFPPCEGSEGWCALVPFQKPWISAQSVPCSWQVFRLIGIKVLRYDLNLKWSVSRRLAVSNGALWEVIGSWLADSQEEVVRVVRLRPD